MNILWLTENYFPNPGGMAESCDRIITQLRKRNINVHIIHFTNSKKPNCTVSKMNGSYTAIQVYNDTSHTLNLCLNFLTNPKRKFNFDKIVAFGGLLPMLAAPVYAKIFKVDLYTLIRGNDFDISVFDPRKKYYLDQVFENSKAICANSYDKAQKIKSLYPELNINYTPNGIDLEKWQLLKSEIEFARQWKKENVLENQKVIGLFGVLKIKKGVVFFINSLLKSGEREKVHLVFTGDIDHEAQMMLLKYKIDFSILSFMYRDELIKYYKVCDWLAIPSFYEGMPNVLLEAGSLGIPVLASNIDGMKDLILNNENGLLFHPSDMEECAFQISNALAMSKTNAEELGGALQKHILLNYKEDNEVNNYMAVFNNDFSNTQI